LPPLTFPTTGPLTALVVEPDESDRAFAARTFTSGRFSVQVARSFDEAEVLLAQGPPSVLLADIRLGDYNGLHLVMRARAAQLRMAALITYDRFDPVLQADADRLGATFITKPVTSRELLAAAFRTLRRPPGDSTPVHRPFERRIRDRRVLPFTPVTAERRGVERRQPLDPSPDRKTVGGDGKPGVGLQG